MEQLICIAIVLLLGAIAENTIDDLEDIFFLLFVLDDNGEVRDVFRNA